LRSARRPTGKLNGVLAETVKEQTDGDGSLNEVIDFEWAGELDGLDPMQATADGAATLRAIGGSAENAWFDATFEVSRIVGRHFGKEAIVGITGRLNDGARNALRGEEFGEFFDKGGQFSGNQLTIAGGEYFG
jgi:hypothetical protein